MFILELISTVLLADFISGLVHWTEDTFWTEETPIIGNWIVKPNILHHVNGGAFVKKSWLESSWDLLSAGVAVLVICALLGFLSWHVWIFVLLIINSNQIHKWSHFNRTKIPYLVKLLQKYWIIQSPKHHANHHRGQKNTHYCVVTNFMNPVLDKTGFWRALESLILPLFKSHRREDLHV